MENDKDKIIASLRKQLQEVSSKNRALEQEVALLVYNIQSKKTKKRNLFGTPMD